MENKNDKKIRSEQLRKKLLVYPVFGLLFVLSMYLIFKPSSSTNKQEINGFNAELPVPATKELTDNKIAAYEKQLLENKQNEKTKSLEDFTFSLSEVETIEKKEPVQKTKNSSVAAVESYKKINRELSTIYQSPTRETKEGKKEKSYNLKSQTDQAKNQYEIMEQSYKMAAKYLNPVSVQPQPSAPVQNSRHEDNYVTVELERENTITRLGEISDSAFIESFKGKRNLGFNTVGTNKVIQRNTIRACINANQILLFGENSGAQTVQLRLLENVRIVDIIIPRNTLITGTAKLSAERIEIVVNSIKYMGNIIPVSLKIYDTDGLMGLNCPGSLERANAKDLGGNLTGNIGTSINVGGNAGQQVVADVSRSVIQGVTNYIGKKIKMVKVSLKANYNVLIVNTK